MKVSINEDQETEEVIINCMKKDSRIHKIEDYVNQITVEMNATINGEIFKVSAGNTLYIESVDRKTFLYTKENVYLSQDSLSLLEERLQRTGIVRISKNCLLNVDSLKSIRPFANHRFEATLKNGEKLLISRMYIRDLKKKLEM